MVASKLRNTIISENHNAAFQWTNHDSNSYIHGCTRVENIKYMTHGKSWGQVKRSWPIQMSFGRCVSCTRLITTSYRYYKTYNIVIIIIFFSLLYLIIAITYHCYNCTHSCHVKGGGGEPVCLCGCRDNSIIYGD